MDAEPLDALARTLATGHSRRGVTRLLGGLALGGQLGLLGLAAAEAKRSKKKTKKGKKAARKQPDATAPSPPTPVTVSCPGPSESGGTGAARHAQTFTASTSGQLVSARLELVNSDAGNDYTLDIRTLDNAGKPSGTILASKRVENSPAASLAAPVTLIAEFSPPALVQAGMGYALAVTVDPTR